MESAAQPSSDPDYEAFFSRLFKKMHASLRRLRVDPDVADELVGAALLEIIEEQGPRPGDLSLFEHTAYLRLKQRGIDRLRRRDTETARLERVRERLASATPETPDVLALRGEIRGLIARIFERLDDGERALAAVWKSGASDPDIARRRGQSVSGLRAAKKRLKWRIGKIVREEGVDIGTILEALMEYWP